jgi:RNA polymerase sigma factor (sigma-70 family)
MQSGSLRKALDNLGLTDGTRTDAQLLAGFRDGGEQAAFAALVRRHGPMVLGVCRRLLGHAQDAEDAFQATFLILARKAASVARGEALAGWLYRVAYRTALEARAALARRRARERQVDKMPEPEAAPAEAQDWRPLLDRELDALPKKYRVAVVLCDLEGKTRREAARVLGLPENTFSSHLSRARRLLAKRLTRRGLSLSGGALAVALSEGAASAAVPAPLMSATVRAAVPIAAGQAAVATPAALLMNEVLKAMLMTKLKFALTAVMMAAVLGAGGLLYRAAGQTAPRDPTHSADQAAPNRPLSEVELLRREVEILKLQMEVVQAELRALKGRDAGRPLRAVRPRGSDTIAAPRPMPTPEPQPGVNRPTVPAPRFQPPATIPNPGAPEPVPPAGDIAPVAPTPVNVEPSSTPAAPAVDPPINPTPVPVEPSSTPTAPAQGPRANEATRGSPEQEVEPALKAFRDALDSRDTEGTRRAAAALEKALKKLRQQMPPASNGPARR